MMGKKWEMEKTITSFSDIDTILRIFGYKKAKNKVTKIELKATVFYGVENYGKV